MNGFPLAVSTWGEEEREAIIKILDSGMMTMGKKVEEFERAYASYVGSKHAVMVNSGSSANLLMVAAYTLREGAGTVIVPPLAWSTSYAPFQQYGWKLKFVDIDPDTLNYSIPELVEAYTGKEIILAVNVLGNPNEFARFPSMRILEDNCESMGAWYGNFRTGSFGIMSSHSMYFSHHIQTMEGGVITTDDDYYHQMLLALRSHGWTRHLPEKNVFGVKPSAYDFVLPGYNVRPIEMMGAVGVEQLKKIKEFIIGRRKNAEGWMKVCEKRGWWHQKEPLGAKSSWFSFAIIDDNIDEIKKELNDKFIDYRPLIAGDFTKSPSIKYYNCEIPEMPNADSAHKGIYIGNFHKPIDWSVF